MAEQKSRATKLSEAKAMKLAIDKHDKEVTTFAQGQARVTFETSTGRYTLAWIVQVLCNYYGRCDTEEERISRNKACDILETLGLQTEEAMFARALQIMDIPVR